MNSTLDDFFGDGEQVCAECGTTENLVPFGAWDAFNGRTSMYLCQRHYDEMKQQQAAQDAEARAQDARLNAIMEDTTTEGE